MGSAMCRSRESVELIPDEPPRTMPPPTPAAKRPATSAMRSASKYVVRPRATSDATTPPRVQNFPVSARQVLLQTPPKKVVSPEKTHGAKGVKSTFADKVRVSRTQSMQIAKNVATEDALAVNTSPRDDDLSSVGYHADDEPPSRRPSMNPDDSEKDMIAMRKLNFSNRDAAHETSGSSTSSGDTSARHSTARQRRVHTMIDVPGVRQDFRGVLWAKSTYDTSDDLQRGVCEWMTRKQAAEC